MTLLVVDSMKDWGGWIWVLVLVMRALIMVIFWYFYWDVNVELREKLEIFQGSYMLLGWDESSSV
jgi:1-acyl-sn-glycerol-3-phosphate acyltransferase